MTGHTVEQLQRYREILTDAYDEAHAKSIVPPPSRGASPQSNGPYIEKALAFKAAIEVMDAEIARQRMLTEPWEAPR